jgi:hypothetical protein
MESQCADDFRKAGLRHRQGSAGICILLPPQKTGLEEENAMRLRFGLSRSVLSWLGVLAVAAGLGTFAFGAGLDGTGGKPVVALYGAKGGTLGNEQIAAEWQLREGRLAALAITRKSRPGTAALKLDGPFALRLRDAGVLHASELSIHGAARVENLEANPAASRFSDRVPGIAVHYLLADPDGRFTVDWALVLRQGSNYIRQVLTVTAGDKPLDLSGVVLTDARAAAMEVAGKVKGSPLVAEDFFLGFESPLAQSSVAGDRGVSELESGVPIGAGQSATYSAVVGIAPQGQMRRAFLTYIERERAHPYRTFLHYNSWFDIGYGNPYTESEALNRIEAIGTELNKKRGVTLDSFLFDDGWDDLGDLWKIRSDFKDGFEPLRKAAARYGTAPGIWLSPWGGYAKAKQDRLATARKGGYEIVDGGLALSGPRYYALFHDAVTEMVTRYGVNQFKFDGTGNANQVVTGSAFSSDFDAAIHLIADLRALKPDIYINLTSGTYPSPFWLFHADSIWRGGDDTGFAGVGTRRERWITYRDAATYDGVVKSGRLYPLNSLMLHGIVYARQAPRLADDPDGDFRNEVRSYFGTGTQLQELYITPSLLTDANWDVLAEAAKWSRANAATLVDTHWVGGDPRWLEVYGWAAWSPKKAILTLRNPSTEAQEVTVDIGKAFELPAGAARRYTARSPWKDEAGQAAIELETGTPHTFHLAPFQVITLEADPR